MICIYGCKTQCSQPQGARNASQPSPGTGRSGSSKNDSYEDTTTSQAQVHQLDVHATGSGRLITTQPQSRLSTIVGDMTPATKLSKEEQILGAHAITLQALLGDKEGLHASTQRHSYEYASAAANAGVENTFRLRATSAPASKRVGFIPPPLDLSAHGHLPENLVRTPYPLGFRRSQPKSPLSNATSPSQPHESQLVLSILRHGRQKHSTRNITTLTIPADLKITQVNTKVGSPITKEKHFATLDFDDAYFFQQLRQNYAKLAGPFRLLSARRLHRIQVHHFTHSHETKMPFQDFPPANSSTPLQYCQSHHSTCPVPLPRSPRLLATQGLTDSFSTSELMKHYHCPRLGKAKYGWVHWAHRLASAAGPSPLLQSPAPNPLSESPGTREREGQREELKDVEREVCAGGLEFVEGLCVWRIVVAMMIVVLLAIAAALLWVFLGLSVQPIGYKGAGGRVGEGAVFGGFVLLVGGAIVGGWIWVSWLLE